MKRVITLFVFIALSIVMVSAQAAAPPPNPATTSPNFTISASALGLTVNGISAPATDIGGTFKVTSNWYLRSDNILIPTFNWTGYFGGLEYGLPQLSGLLKNTTLNSNSFWFYATGAVGESRVSLGSAPPVNHFATLLGGGVNYSPLANKTFTVNLAEFRWMHAPGLAQNNTFLLSSGITLGWNW